MSDHDSDAENADDVGWSEDVQRELERLQRACGEERLPPVLEREEQQRELARRAEAPREAEALDGVAAAAQRVVVPREELDDADAVALSAQVRTVADRNDLALLAEELTRRSSDPLVQARAIFRWVADAIAFDARADELPPQDAASVLERRSAAGDGHAKLVQALGQLANLRISCVYGHGRSRSWRFMASDQGLAAGEPPVNHCWNAIYAGGSWRLLDAAWAAGSVSPDGQFNKAFDEAYWLPSPAMMAVSHKPVLPGWQMLAEPITDQQFRRSVPCGAAFFRHGLELLSHPADGVIQCGQRVAILLGHAPHVQVHFTCVLVEERNGEETVASDGWPHDCYLVEMHETWTCIHVTAPPQTDRGTDSRWELRVMVAPGFGIGGYAEDTYRSMEWCVSYRLDFGVCMETPLPSRFPYVARGATVIAPTNRGIESGRVRFRIRWSGPAPSTVSVVVPGIAAATPLGYLQAVSTAIVGETQYFGLIDVDDAEADILRVQAEFDTATGTKTICLAEYCTFAAKQPNDTPGRELRTKGLQESREKISRPVPVVPSTLPVQSWGVMGTIEERKRARPPIDISGLAALGQAYSDAEFSPESGCLCHDITLLRETVREEIADQWSRVTWMDIRAVPGKTVSGAPGLDTLYALGEGQPEPLFATESDNGWQNIIGGFLGDCAFLSCLTVLAEDMRLIRRIFVGTPDFASTGVFVARFSKRGEVAEVLVDGPMPVLLYADLANDPLPAFCHAVDCLWPALLQKAYAKLRGSYQQTLGDSPSFILQALTGAPSEVHPLADDDDALEDIWGVLLHAMEKGHVVCACAAERTGVNLGPKQESHAYAVLKIRDIPELDEQLVLLRNPLAQAWNETGAEVSPATLQDNPLKRKEDAERWPPELCQILGVDGKLQAASNSEYWVNLKDMHCFFDTIVVNKSSGGHNYHSTTSRVDCHTTIGGGTAFFVVEVDDASTGDAVVAVVQHGSSVEPPGSAPLSFAIWNVSTGKQVGAVGPTAANTVSLECCFDRVGEYYVIVDLVDNRDVSQQVVLGVTSAGTPCLSAVPQSVPLGGGLHKVVAKNGRRDPQGFYDPDSYFKYGLAGVSMISWGMWSPAHLRYWRFILHENGDDNAQMSEVMRFELENMAVFQEAQPWVVVSLQPKQRSMLVLQSVGQASMNLNFQVTSRKLQLENWNGGAPAFADSELLTQKTEAVTTQAEIHPPVDDAQTPDEPVPQPKEPVTDRRLQAKQLDENPQPDEPVQEPRLQVKQSHEHRRDTELSTNDTIGSETVRVQPGAGAERRAERKGLEDEAQTAADSEHERLRAQAAARLKEHQREVRDRKQQQDARAEELGLRLELERRDEERNKLKEAQTGFTSIDRVAPPASDLRSAPGRQAVAGIDMPRKAHKELGRQSKGRTKFTAEAARATHEADGASEESRAAKLELRARKRAQHKEDRIQQKRHEANVMRVHTRMSQSVSGDSWEQVSELAKREAVRMLRREHERKEKQRKDRERRAHLRRQKQLEVLQMKASTNLNNWEEMHAKVEADNAARAKAAAARYTAQQKKKLQRDEFERKKKAMLEEQRKKIEQAKRKKWQDSERRRKEALAQEAADAKAQSLAQAKSKATTSGAAKRAAAITNIQERLRNLFNIPDSDGDESLSKSELATLLKDDHSFMALLKDAGMKPAYILQQLGGDGDETITFLEFVQVIDLHRKTIQEGTRESVFDSLAGIANAGDVAVLSNNTMELRMRVLLEQQMQKEAKEREERAADIERQIVQEDANQRMRQSMQDFDQRRKEEFAKIEDNARQRRKALVDKQRTYQQRLHEMKKRQSQRSEPFFLAGTNATLPKTGSAPGQRYICEKDTPIHESVLSERSLRLELQGMDLHMLRKRAAAAGVATEHLSSSDLVDNLMMRNKVGTLKIGEEVVALEERIDEDNVLRIRTARGWIAHVSADGIANVRPNQLAWLPTGVKLTPKLPEQAPRGKHLLSGKSRQSTVSHEANDSKMCKEGFIESNPDTTSYQVEFSSGDAGDIIGDMYLRLQGTLGSSKTVLCSNVVWQHCDRGSLCSFIFQAPWLGQIKSVAVGHNVGENTHDRSTRLLLSNVVVKHVETGTVWRFPCQQWLDDVSRMCVIPEAGSAISDGGHNAARSISYSGARVSFTPEEQQKLHRIAIRLRAIAPETTSVPVTVELEGSQRGRDHVKTVQLSFQIPDTTFTTTVESVGKFQSAEFGPLRSCTIRDVTGACTGLGSKVQVYVDCVIVEVEGSSSSSYFDCHRWLDSKAATTVDAGPTPRGLEAAKLTHPSKRGLVEQMRDMTATATNVPASSDFSADHSATWRDVAEWGSNMDDKHMDGIVSSDATAHNRGDAMSAPTLDPGRESAAAAATAAAEAGQLPSATEAELLQHHRSYQEGKALVEGEDMVYVVRVTTGGPEAAKALRQPFRSAPPTVALTLFGTHGPPMMVDVPITFIPYNEECFVVRVQQYHGILQGVRVRIDDTIPGAPALPFKWNLLSLTITDIRRMQTWHSTCRSVFECSNSVAAALLRPTATGRSAAHRVTLILGPGTADTAQHSRLQVFISSVGGEGSVALIALPFAHDDGKLSTRAVLQCPAAWLPCLGEQLELGLCQCDDAAPTASVHVSQAIVIRDGVEKRFRFERHITAGAVHYGTPMNLPQEADLLKLDGGNISADPLRVDPVPVAEFVLRLHYTETCLYSTIACCIGYWELEPNSSKFAVAWTPMLLVANDAAYYAARESYEFPLRLPSPGAELWGIKIEAQGSSWGIGFVELVDPASREVYRCNCDGSPLVREELADGTKSVSRELVFATKQPLEPVSRDPKISPWEEWKQDQVRRADAAAEKERRAAGQRGALEMGLQFASKAAQAMHRVSEREEQKQRQEAEARERELQRKAEEELLRKQTEEADRRNKERQEAERLAFESAEAARLRVEAAERAAKNNTPEEKMMQSKLDQVMAGTANKFSVRECREALAMARNNVPDAILRVQMGTRR